MTAVLRDAQGERVGTATLTRSGGGTEVDVEVAGLPPGFHGFHVHAIGLCEPSSPNPSDPAVVGDFLSAGGHLDLASASHGQHTGDLSSLLVDAEGDGELEADTGAFVPQDLLDDDGSAVMVHAGPDNFANVPERYAPGGPDDVTRATGDSGGRIACGVVEDD